MLLRNLALWPDCLYFAFFPMKILGIDFTSRPGRGKPLICVECEFAGNQLAPHALRKWESFQGFEAALAQPGPWVAGIDFPFGQSGKFVRNIGWPASWADYVDHVASMSREQFRQLQPESSTRRHVPVNLRRRRHRRQPRRPLLRHPGRMVLAKPPPQPRHSARFQSHRRLDRGSRVGKHVARNTRRRTEP